ncbi:MAG: hypothetical protein HW383_718 [Candidatus Magasanikbacteria bacterium]|nr:hypothetical protein [Candidatus Magasanikbacteria bacterium]
MSIFWKSFFIALAVTVVSVVGFFFPAVRLGGFVLIVGAALWLAWKKPAQAFLIVALEWVAGHEGHLFEAGGVSLRLALFAVLMLASARYLYQCDIRLKNCVRLLADRFGAPVRHAKLFLVIIALAVFAAVIGWWRGNDLMNVARGFISYGFYLTAVPLVIFWNEIKNRRDQWIPWIVGAIAAVSLVTLILFLGFSWGQIAVHDSLYNWWREFAGGKATDTGLYFFRLASPTHLLNLLFFFVLGYSWRDSFGRQRRGERRALTLMLAVVILGLVINFSRAYFLGLAVGSLGFFIRAPWKKSVAIVALTAAIFFGEFAGLNLLASNGKTFGLELLRGRAVSLIAPETETSSRLRQEILPMLFSAIGRHKILGSGLGTEITFWSASSERLFKTRSFDWGYLQMWIELGLLGAAFLTAFILLLNWRYFKSVVKNGDTTSGIGWSSSAALMVTAIFTPVIFHPLGIITIVFLWRLSYDNPYEI